MSRGPPGTTGVMLVVCRHAALPRLGVENKETFIRCRVFRQGGFRDGWISLTTRDDLVRYGFGIVFPAPWKSVRPATVQVQHPLPLDLAVRLSGLFIRRRKPCPVT